jgi:hypothetical protein
MNLPVEDILVRQQAEFERVIADALWVGGKPIYDQLIKSGWKPEVATDVKAFFNAFPYLAAGNYQQKCLNYFGRMFHGFGILFRWEKNYLALVPDESLYSASAVEFAQREIRGIIQARRLLQHFAYVIQEQANARV